MLTYDKMKTSSRLSSEDRREAIVEAVKGVFAEKGFDGTTTRELANAAGVSEALLYKHFPSKESLYAALLGDGAFVRLTHKKFANAWIKKFAACLNEGAKAGDLRKVPERSDLRVWFVHHIAF